ncbi:MAG: hypothetical protein GY928_01550 [Colwellia sp.]|nr:hypothetical protein [Colwellia sp.]
MSQYQTSCCKSNLERSTAPEVIEENSSITHTANVLPMTIENQDIVIVDDIADQINC